MGVPGFVDEELEALERRGRSRWLRRMEGPHGPVMTVDGRKAIVLASSNCLGLSTHPRVTAAAADAAAAFDLAPSTTHILPLHVGEGPRTMTFCERLLEAGVFAQGIRFPTVPEGTERLRLTPMATHTPEQLQAACRAIVAVALLVGLQEAGLRVAALKPVETGCALRDGRPVPADAAYLRDVGRLPEGLEAIAPYAFPLPAAPWAAARDAGATISLDRIAAAYAALAARADCVLVEGAGGLLVPLADGLRFPEVARRLGTPLLVVARTALGTLNHTQLTVREARRAGLEILGVVLNDGRARPTAAEEANLALLDPLLGVQILGRLPPLPGRPPARRTLAAAARAHLKLLALRDALGA